MDTALQANKYLLKSFVVENDPMDFEGCDSTALDALKNRVSVIINMSNAMSHLTDLTHEEFVEYLRQIRSNAYKMDEILNHLRIR